MNPGRTSPASLRLALRSRRRSVPTATRLHAAFAPMLSHEAAPAASNPVIDTTAALASRLFERLSGLHGLLDCNSAVVPHAVAGLTCIRASGLWGSSARLLLRMALDDLATTDAAVAEVAACYACDREPSAESLALLGPHGRTRALWVAAVVRLSEAVALAAGGPVAGVHAAWTDTVLHVELDGIDRSCDVSHTVNHAAALEMLSGRTVMVTSSTLRRSVAQHPATRSDCPGASRLTCDATPSWHPPR